MKRRPPNEIKDLLKVYFIMGSQNCGSDPREVLKEAIAGGITLFQFREKGTGSLKGSDKLRLAKDLKEICQINKIPFIVNDDLELALELEADGMHIGQEDLPANEVRKHLGENQILGVSAHSEEEARLAILQGADYLGIGPIFPTTTKEDANPARGMGLIEDLRKQSVGIPIVGIGGIKASNAGQVMRGGADGVSVITAISQADRVETATLELKRAVYNAY